MRGLSKRHLRMAEGRSHSPGMEPLARAVRDAMDAAGLDQADVVERTGLTRQHVSQIVNRTQGYGRAPNIATLQALAKIPGLSLQMIADAVARSTGQPRPPADALAPVWSPLRRSVHAVVDKIAEEDLPRALQILVALLG